MLKRLPKIGTEVIGYKKLWGGVIAQLIIPAEAQRVCGGNQYVERKCRAEYAAVVGLFRPVWYNDWEIITEEAVASSWDSYFFYKLGEIARPTNGYDPEPAYACRSGIHFFLTLDEALNS